ncbi:glycosyl transferase [Jannaschia sp. S6380]|uniref:glycosyltransferase n=1 Tax=Jannaschia sp. S6380 TaxID=2926408 RepID=UPI001FF34496|nr:glycosyltransferase [Jannaschia sp. S6380]MCK0168498.1 glycosyl transferase [Jannaschia sp. S6380]
MGRARAMKAPGEVIVQGTGRGKLLVFGFDANEAAQRRRIRAYLDCGFDVLGFTMRRSNMIHDTVPFWDNVDLGRTRNAAMGQRLGALARAIPILRRHRDRMQGAHAIVARNLDMLILAAAAQRMIRPRPRLIYECLDIHGLMTGDGPASRAARALERRLLARCDAIVISSPAFQRVYFGPVQGWTGETRLVENKLWTGPDGPHRPKPEARPRPRPTVLGWVGTLRCPESLDILARTARAMGPEVEIRLHGIVHRHGLPDFDAVLAATPNMTFHGPYAYPDGLAAIYAACDVVWAQDLWQWGTNSTWLLPNRIYEAGYFGCPSIAVAGTETGRRVADAFGWTVFEPSAEALVALLTDLTPEALGDRRRALLEMPEDTFRQSIAEVGASVS